MVLFDSTYWNGFLGWLRDCVLTRGSISEPDFDLLRVCDHSDEAIEAVQRWYTKQEVIGEKQYMGKETVIARSQHGSRLKLSAHAALHFLISPKSVERGRILLNCIPTITIGEVISRLS